MNSPETSGQSRLALYLVTKCNANCGWMNVPGQYIFLSFNSSSPSKKVVPLTISRPLKEIFHSIPIKSVTFSLTNPRALPFEDIEVRWTFFFKEKSRDVYCCYMQSYKFKFFLLKLIFWIYWKYELSELCQYLFTLNLDKSQTST